MIDNFAIMVSTLLVVFVAVQAARLDSAREVPPGPPEHPQTGHDPRNRFRRKQPPRRLWSRRAP